MRFKSRIYNSLSQGLSGKNEKPVRLPWRWDPRVAGPNTAASA